MYYSILEKINTDCACVACVYQYISIDCSQALYDRQGIRRWTTDL